MDLLHVLLVTTNPHLCHWQTVPHCILFPPMSRQIYKQPCHPANLHSTTQARGHNILPPLYLHLSKTQHFPTSSGSTLTTKKWAQKSNHVTPCHCQPLLPHQSISGMHPIPPTRWSPSRHTCLCILHALRHPAPIQSPMMTLSGQSTQLLPSTKTTSPATFPSW